MEKGIILMRGLGEIKDGTLLLHQKRRGTVIYQVPIDSKDLQLVIKFDSEGKTATFNL